MTAPRGTRDEWVPARPLGMLLERLAKRETAVKHDKSGEVSSSMDVMAERAGVDVRQIHRWRVGAVTTVAPDAVDRVLVRLDLCWFDVWNADTVRRPALTVSVFNFRTSRLRDGRAVRRRVLTATRYHGDLGPDYEAIGRVRRLFDWSVPEEIAQEDAFRIAAAELVAGRAPLPLNRDVALRQALRLRTEGMLTYGQVAWVMSNYHGVHLSRETWRTHLRQNGAPPKTERRVRMAA